MLVTGYPPREEGIVIAPLAEVSQSVIVASPFATEYVYIPSVSADAFIVPSANMVKHTINTVDKIFFFILFFLP